MHIIDQILLDVFLAFFIIVLRGASLLSFLLVCFRAFFIVHDNGFDNDLF